MDGRLYGFFWGALGTAFWVNGWLGVYEDGGGNIGSCEHWYASVWALVYPREPMLSAGIHGRMSIFIAVSFISWLRARNK
jgi:hypothetical protein